MSKQTANFVVRGERISVDLELRPLQGNQNRLTVDFEPVPADAVEVSLCGTRSGSSGQINLSDVSDVDPHVALLVEHWERWHLNAMKAGCRVQNAWLDGHADTPKDYEARCKVLAAADLLEVPTSPGSSAGLTYKYGSRWLVELCPPDVIKRIKANLAWLDGKRLGEAPNVSDAPELDGDVIDSRDIIKRLEIYRDAAENIDPHTGDPELQDILAEFKALEALEHEASGCGDWDYGATLIRDSYFEQYARDFADDIGAVDRDAKWPNDHIDWKAAAKALQADYISVEFHGETWWIRS